MGSTTEAHRAGAAMKVPKTFWFVGVITLNFLILLLGTSISLNFDSPEGLLTISLVDSKNPLRYETSSFGLMEKQTCLGPFYEKSELYDEALELRGFGIFAKKKILQLGNFEQGFWAIGNQSSFGENETIMRELDLLEIAYFKVRESQGFRVFVELALEPEARDLQMNGLVSLGRPLEYIEFQRPSRIYLLLIADDDRIKLTDNKEKECRGIAPLAWFL